MKKIFLILGMMLGGVGGAWGKLQTPVTDFETRLPIEITDCRTVTSCGTDEIKKCFEAINCPGNQVCYCYPNPIIPDTNVCVPEAVTYTQDVTFVNGCTMYRGVEIICNNSGNAKRITTYACEQGCYVNRDAGDTPDCRECPGVGNQAASSLTKSIVVGNTTVYVTFDGILSCYLPQNNKYTDDDGTFEIVTDKACMY